MQLNATALAAYGKIIEASNLGINVKPYVEAFNNALNYSMSGNDDKAIALLTGINVNLSRLISAKLYTMAITAALIAASLITVLALVILFRGRLRDALINLITNVWLRLRGEDYVYLSNTPSEEVEYLIGIVLGIVLILAVFAYLSYEIPLWYQFEGVGILTSSGFANYPSNVPVGSNVTLIGLVYSHRSEPSWYVVYVELNGTVIKAYSRLMTFNQTWLFPVTLSLSKPGHYNLTLALYIIEPEGNLKYTGVYARLLMQSEH